MIDDNLPPGHIEEDFGLEDGEDSDELLDEDFEEADFSGASDELGFAPDR